MKAFKEMDPEAVWKLLEGHENVLNGLVQKEQAFFRTCTCPSCGSRELEQFVDAQRPFQEGSPLPKTLLRCRPCGTEFDGHTGLICRVTTA